MTKLRLGIILFGIFCGWFIFGLNEVLRNDSEEVPNTNEDLFWACVLSSPFFLLALFIKSRKNETIPIELWGTALVVEGFILHSGLLLPQLLPFVVSVTLMLVLWSEKTSSRLFLRKIAWFGLVCLWFSWVWLANPLPNDEEMIEYFQLHRTKFEEVSLIYANNGKVSKGECEQIGVDYMRSGQSINNKLLIQEGKNFRFLPTIIEIKLIDKRYEQKSFRYEGIYKTYTYFPIASKVENGKLLIPSNIEETISTSIGSVLSSLDFFPFGWDTSGCFYRRIEAQWFIQMCSLAR